MSSTMSFLHYREDFITLRVFIGHERVTQKLKPFLVNRFVKTKGKT